jgi:hypothetical protein
VAGFIGQNKGFFFRKRYKIATIFVNHFSRLSYVYLQESTKGVQTLAAKRSFEAYSASHGVKVQQYHANNGRFAEHLFLNHCEKSGQKVSLYVESVHTSKMASLKEGSRISLKGPERPCYTPFTGGPQQSQTTCGHMHFATSVRYTMPLLP